jgi:hypothetical protein
MPVGAFSRYVRWAGIPLFWGDPTLTPVANSRGTEGTELERREVGAARRASGVPLAQDAIRKKLIATAVMTCCRRVLARPR